MLMLKPPKYPRTPWCPWSTAMRLDYEIAVMRWFVRKDVVITEKLDGSNTLLHRGKAHNRSTDAAHAAPWPAMARKHHAWKTASLPNLQFYGEDIYGVHAIEYDPVPEDATFRLFAIRKPTNWASWDEVAAYAQRLDMLTAPVLYRGIPQSEAELQRKAETLMRLPSKLGPENEGLVIRIAASFPRKEFERSVCKIVRPGHVPPDAEHWSRRWRPCALLSQPAPSPPTRPQNRDPPI